MLKRFWKRRSCDKGQAMVEFALVFPVQLIITMGIIQLGLLFIGKMVVRHAAYAAARAQMVNENPKEAACLIIAPIAGGTMGKNSMYEYKIPGWHDDSTDPLEGGLEGSSRTYVIPGEDLESGSNRYQVEVVHHFHLQVPFIGWIISRTYHLLTPNCKLKDGKVVSTFQEIEGEPHITLAESATVPAPWEKTHTGYWHALHYVFDTVPVGE